MVHALTPQAIRLLAGISRRVAALRARVCRDTILRYEVDPRLVKLPEKRWLCQEFYAGLQRELAAEQQRARRVQSGAWDDEEPAASARAA